jgi:hypothetical protein
VLCGPDNSPSDQGARQILETEGYRFYENQNPMGRLTLLHRIAGVVESEKEFLRKIRSGFDYLSEAYVDGDRFEEVRQSLGSSQMVPSAQDRIEKIVDQPNRSYSAIESGSASLLILNEWFTPAWKVRVNSKNQPVLRVNEWQTGVLLPAGKNRVEFEYRPTLFRLLMALNRIAIVLLLLFGIYAVVRKARDRSRKGQSPDQVCS